MSDLGPLEKIDTRRNRVERIALGIIAVSMLPEAGSLTIPTRTTNISSET